MSRQKNSILINERALNREPVPLNPGFGTPNKCRFLLIKVSLQQRTQDKGYQRRGSTGEWSGLVISFDCFVPMCPLLLFKHDGFVRGEYPAAKGQLLYVPF